MNPWGDSDEVVDALEEHYMQSTQSTSEPSTELARTAYSLPARVNYNPEVYPSKMLDRRTRRELEYKKMIGLYEIELSHMLKRLKMMLTVQLVMERGDYLMRFVNEVELAMARGITQARFLVMKTTYRDLEQTTAAILRDNRW